MIVASGTIDGIPTVVAAMEYGFIGGSMGVVVGEKITRGIERAIDRALPVVIVCCSGGARMMEGALSLMQMAKICGALARLDRARLPYISVLTDPTTGGVTASFAMLGDLNIAEPKALIGFAGPRVIEQTIRQKLPEGFQRSEFLLEKGMLDLVVDRREMKSVIANALRFMGAAPAAAPRQSPRRSTSRRRRDEPAPQVLGGRPLAYLFGLEQFGIKFGLDNISTHASTRLGHPERAFRSVHIAGTNGKGSVTAMVDAALRAAGHRSARYTSPHLVDLSRALRHRRPAGRRRRRCAPPSPTSARPIDALRADGDAARLQPTFFEVTTARRVRVVSPRAASRSPSSKSASAAGSTRPTSSTPVATAITSIDFDHQQYLGTTLREIAVEKAGIIKPGVPVVVGDVGRRSAGRRSNASPPSAARSSSGRATESTSYARARRIRGQHRDAANARTRLRSGQARARGVIRQQCRRRRARARNARCPRRRGDRRCDRRRAGAACRGRAGWNAVAVTDGRELLLDAAHNPAGAAALASYLHGPRRDTTAARVRGDARQGRRAGCCAALLPSVGRLIVTRASNPRSADPRCARRDGASRSRRRCRHVVPSSGEALAAAWHDVAAHRRRRIDFPARRRHEGARRS